MTLGDPKTIVGNVEEPNTIWLAVGRWFAIIAPVLTYVSFQGFGASFVPIGATGGGIILIVGLWLMWYGTILKKNWHIATQAQALKLAQANDQFAPHPPISEVEELLLAMFDGPKTPDQVRQMKVTGHTHDAILCIAKLLHYRRKLKWNGELYQPMTETA